MQLRSRKVLLYGVLLTLACVGFGLVSLATADAPKNVIVMISDGCSYNQIDATSYYQYGAAGVQVYESFPYIAGMATYAGDGNGYGPEDCWSDFDYIKDYYTDSAAAATAMSCGIKTYGGAIGVDMYQEPVEHIAERLKEVYGKATGVVSSVEFSHATPAAYVAHNVSRNNYAQIAQEMLCDSRFDVIMGCGNPWYNDDGEPVTEMLDPKYVGGQYCWESIQAGLTDIVIDEYGTINPVEDCDGDGLIDAWHLIESRADIQAMAQGDTPVRLLAVPETYKTLQYNRSGHVPTDPPFTVPWNENVATLEEMTQAALNVLDNDEDGFFLMVEGGAVDWAGHGNSHGRVIEEEIDFNDSVEAVVAWVETHSNWDETLLIVTGDHETGYLTGPGSGGEPPVWNPIENNGAGNLPGMEWHSGSHTNQLIPVYAKGSCLETMVPYTDEFDPERGLFINNTELATVLFELYPAEPVTVPENIIVLISDGCGYNQVDAASIYQYGETGTQVYEQWPLQVAMSTYAGDGNGYATVSRWNDFGYINDYYTDSAAAATAMSCGIKTYGGAIGMDMNQQPVMHIIERAEELNKSTGVVTSVEFSHATPAAYVAHNVSRNNYEEIAVEMICDSRVDVIMGCGHPWYDNDGQLVPEMNNPRYVGGESMWNGILAGGSGFDTDNDGQIDNYVEDSGHPGTADAIRDPWTFIETREQFQALMEGPAPTRVLGIPQVYQTLQYNRGGHVPTDPPYATPLIESVPTLAEMTRGALNVLDDNPNGFFLMVEGGAVDWAGHGNSHGRVIEEEIDFNLMVAAVVEWVETNSDWSSTLVIVTGDHETGYLAGPGSGGEPPVWNPIENNGAGNLPGMEWHSGSHTNQLIPLYAKGEALAGLLPYIEEHDLVQALYINNTELAQASFRLWQDELPGDVADVPVESYAQVGPRVYFQSPFRPAGTISFALPRGGEVELAVYGVGGRKVETLRSGHHEAGVYTVRWDATHVPAGVYFARLAVGDDVATRKLIMAK